MADYRCPLQPTVDPAAVLELCLVLPVTLLLCFAASISLQAAAA
jgi:hypothetical protein